MFLFPIVVLEGPVVTFVSGWLVALGYLNPITTFLVVVLGDEVGDFIFYLIGRFGSKRLLNYAGRWVRMTPKRLQRMKHLYDRHAGRIITFGKFSHSVGAPVLIAAGLVEVSWRKFTLISILGTVIQTVALLVLGYYFGDRGQAFESGLSYLAIASFLIFIVLSVRFGRRLVTEGE